MDNLSESGIQKELDVYNNFKEKAQRRNAGPNDCLSMKIIQNIRPLKYPNATDHL